MNATLFLPTIHTASYNRPGMFLLRAVILLLIVKSANAGPPTQAFVQLPTVRLHYVDWQGDGEPIVLLPGGCQTAHVFGDLAPLLTQKFRVYALTPRGCGQSGAAADGYGIDRHIDDLIRFLDALGIEQAVFAGHSSGGGVVVRLANRYPRRVSRIVTFDIVYSGVPEQFDGRMEQAIASKLGPQGPLSLETHRANFQVWELGVWSGALEQDFREGTERQPDGSLRYRPRRPEWHAAFVAEMRAGSYFESTLKRPALFFVARDLDLNRVRQFSADQRQALLPMAKAIGAARRKQVKAFRQNGVHVKVIWLSKASHYLFVDHAQAVAREMMRFMPLSHDLDGKAN